MQKKAQLSDNFIYLIIFLVIFILIFILAFYVQNKIKESQSPEAKIKTEIEAANYCTIKENCTLIKVKCTSECYILINKKELNKINNVLNAYQSNINNILNSGETKCIYNCIKPENYDCLENKCVQTDN